MVFGLSYFAKILYLLLSSIKSFTLITLLIFQMCIENKGEDNVKQ